MDLILDAYAYKASVNTELVLLVALALKLYTVCFELLVVVFVRLDLQLVALQKR